MDERTRRVLSLAAAGSSPRETALLLGTTTDEVRRVIARAIIDLGATSKLEAIVFAMRRGLLD